MDQHTFYAGVSKKIDFGKSSIIVRSAFQYIRNMHTIPTLGYGPYLEWRNRIRFKYDMTNRMSASISGEPYLHFDNWTSTPRISRARFIAQCDWMYNKYTTFSLYFLLQPSNSVHTGTSFKNVIGFTYQLDLPKKLPSFKKIGTFDKIKHKNQDITN
jgi:hypothetical protein